MIKSKVYKQVSQKISIIEAIKALDKEITELTRIADYNIKEDAEYSINIYHNSKDSDCGVRDTFNFNGGIIGYIQSQIEEESPKPKKKEIPSVHKLKLTNQELLSTIGALISCKKEQIKQLLLKLEE